MLLLLKCRVALCHRDLSHATATQKCSVPQLTELLRDRKGADHCIGKRLLADRAKVTARHDPHTTHSGTAVKRKCSDRLYAFRDIDRQQSAASVKRIRHDLCQMFRQAHLPESCIVLKGGLSDTAYGLSFDRMRYGQIFSLTGIG